jgi:hypothetical protein
VSSEFDTKNCRDFTGTLTSVSWQNPHMHFMADVKDASGKVESWQFQGYSTLTMTRAGTSRQDFLDNVGKEISVRGCLGAQRDRAQGRRRRAEARGWTPAPGRPATGQQLMKLHLSFRLIALACLLVGIGMARRRSSTSTASCRPAVPLREPRTGPSRSLGRVVAQSHRHPARRKSG